MSLKKGLKYSRFLRRIHSVVHQSPHQSPLSFLSGYVSKLDTTSKNKQLSNSSTGTSTNGLVSVKMNHLGQLVQVKLNSHEKMPLDKATLEKNIIEACYKAWTQFRDMGIQESNFEPEQLWALTPAAHHKSSSPPHL
mmetsp:Transcript_11572/g.43449  ORF Transcript_11572/g.43449 Transcript_11572/m.43449 type:complete len:137 (-) Transcript_11572:3-413(-)